MPRRPPATIGTVNCPICAETGALRRSRDDKLYYVCACGGGSHYLEGSSGQAFLDKHGHLWDSDDPPPGDGPKEVCHGDAAELEAEADVHPYFGQDHENERRAGSLSRAGASTLIVVTLLAVFGRQIWTRVTQGLRQR